MEKLDKIEEIREITAWLYEVCGDFTETQVDELHSWLLELQTAYVFGDGPPAGGMVN